MRPSSTPTARASGTDAAEVIQIVSAQVYYRVFITGEPPSQVIAGRAAVIAAAAARAGAGIALEPVGQQNPGCGR